MSALSPGDRQHALPVGDPRPAAEAQAPGKLRLRDLLSADVSALYRSRGGDAGEPDRLSALTFRLLNKLEHHSRHYRFRVVYCPPMPLLWGFLPGDGSTPSFLHKSFLRHLWGERGLPGRAGLLAQCLLLAPLVILGTCLWATCLNGRAIARRTGVPVARQVIQQLWIAGLFGILPPWYYTFDLHNPDSRSRAGDYVLRQETKGGLYRFVKTSATGGNYGALSDKVQFNEECLACGIPVLTTLAIAEGGRIAFGEAGENSLPPIDLFIKPQRGRGGRGASWWHYADGRYVDSAGTVLTPAAFAARIEEASRREPFLIEPRAINHAAIRDLSNGALCTARIITMEDERGGFEPVAAAFRMAVGENRVVDNFHAGGIVANVDIATGALGPAGDMALRPERGWCTHHPDTGGVIAGRRLPLWRETLELTSQAHRCFSGRTLIGWDVAILDDGPRVIEANGAPDVDLHQRCGGPLGTTRFGALLAYHIRRVEALEVAAKSGA